MTGLGRACRNATLADLIILVGATAVGLALLRWTWPGYWPTNGYSWPSPGGGTARTFIDSALRHVLGAAPPLLLAWMAGFLAIRLRGPRPRWRQLARRPGTAAAIASMLAVLLILAMFAGVNGTPGRSLEFWYTFLLLSYLAGPSVIGAWATLASTGLIWRGAGWIERLGIGLGIGWIALTVAALYSFKR
jgi:hypothetical protein